MGHDQMSDLVKERGVLAIPGTITIIVQMIRPMKQALINLPDHVSGISGKLSQPSKQSQRREIKKKLSSTSLLTER